jgi:hypothetical protein
LTAAAALRSLREVLRAGDPSFRPSIDEATSGDGSLEQPIAIEVDFDVSVLQWALARQGLHATVEAAPRARAHLTPPEVRTIDDVIRLAEALGSIAGATIFVGGPLAATPSDGWRLAHELAPATADGAVFWSYQSHREAFDARGTLRDTLHVQWIGALEPVLGVIVGAGFEARRPDSPKRTLQIEPAGASERSARAASQHQLLAEELLRRGWEEEFGLERWFHWPPGTTDVQVAKAQGSTIVVLLDRSALEVQIDAGGDLEAVLGELDRRREALRATEAVDVLAALDGLGTKVRWRRGDAEWKELIE